MADDRISKSTAELVGLPPTEWTVKKVSWLLEQDSVIKNIQNVPVNEKLLESLKRDRMINPILCMPEWYPIVGSQRIRCCWHLKEIEPDHPNLQQEIRVARFEKEYWNLFYLWGNEEFRSKAIAVWFQMAELAWKSIHYIQEKDFAGTEMREFERIGDQLKWNITEEQRQVYQMKD